jgi:hypothetical protein
VQQHQCSATIFTVFRSRSTGAPFGQKGISSSRSGFACSGVALGAAVRGGFPPRSTVYNIFRKFQRDGAWEAIWAELHMALREHLGRAASPGAAVLDSQSVKSGEKGAVKTTQ